MDSDGCFYLSKKNYLSCEITLSIREVNSLYKIKSKFGGSIKLRTNAHAIR
jgi:ubiquinol-cytochrome c reductase cytochrome b subunit